jgi:hypothetical protein
MNKSKEIEKTQTTISAWAKRRGKSLKMVVRKWEIGTNQKGKKIYASETKHIAA